MDNQINKKILSNLNNLENKIKKLDSMVLENKDYVLNDLYIYKKELIRISLEYDKYLFNNQNNDIIEHKIKNINQNIDLLIEFNNLNINIKKHKHISNISLINTIFLPLALITGYFGMNFSKMGSPTLKKGILSINHAHKFVFILFLCSIILTLLLFYYNILF